MRTRDERFLHAVLARGARDAEATQALRDAIARLDAPWHGVDVRSWHHGTQAGMRLATATKGTVQVGFAERLAEGATSFGLVKLRARVLYATHGRHVLRFSREMPAGWPENGIAERDERAITGRTAPVPEGSIELAVPILTPTLMHTERFEVSRLERVVATLAALDA